MISYKEWAYFMKLACLDDCKVQLGVYKVALKEYKPVLYSSPEKFLNEINTSNIDILILDLIMPYICGIEVCKRLRENENTRNIKIIFVTSMEGEEFKLLAEKCGAIALINKGNLHDLKKELDKWMH